MNVPKRNRGLSLSAALGEAVAAETRVEELPPKAAPRPPEAKPTGVPLSILITPADRRRLRQLSLDSDMSLQQLGHAAWNLLLTARGLPELEPTTANRPSGLKRG